MRGERVEVLHRIKGQGALLKSARGLQLRVHRFGRGRARTPGEIKWTARALDALDLVVKAMEQPALDAASPATAPTSPTSEARS